MMYCNAFGFMPALAKLVQNVCPYGIIRTNRNFQKFLGDSGLSLFFFQEKRGERRPKRAVEKVGVSH